LEAHPSNLPFSDHVCLKDKEREEECRFRKKQVELLVMPQVVEHLLDVVELGLVVAAGIVDAVVDDPELLRSRVDIDAVDDPDAPP
jgi:hypothetical protein